MISRSHFSSLALCVLIATGLTACADPSGGTVGRDTTGPGDTGGDTLGSDTHLIGDYGDTHGGQDTLLPPLPDDDGDGIANDDEGTGDTDLDGIPDYLDNDADGDGIPDLDEAGDTDTNSPPIDSDLDGTPDFLDTDSDDNGVPDSVELAADPDGDGIPNYRDSDNDGDGINDAIEIAGGAGDCNGDGLADPAGTPANPWDCNGDGTPDYLSRDADGDFIDDRIEGLNTDTDQDGFLDRYDRDSDGDGFTDADEAGDQSLDTPPRDFDLDGTYDFRDIDSDNDGVLDVVERMAGTNPRAIDTDNDGADDLVETTAGTDPLNFADNPQANGDFVFRIPYNAPTTPTEDTLEFKTSIQFADVYFAIDTTGSMGQELSAMRSSTTGISTIVNTLTCQSTGGSCAGDDQCLVGVCFNGRCIENPVTAAGGAGCVPDLWTGVARFDDLNTFTNLLSLQANPATTASSVPASTGGGGWEAIYQPPYCVANRSACGNSCASSGIGCGGFRQQAIRIYVQITDADNQCYGGGCSSYTASGAGAALAAQNIKFVALVGPLGDDSSTDPLPLHQQIGAASGTTTASPYPFVYRALDAAVATQAVQAIRDIARGVPLNVTIATSELPDDDGDALRFIDYLEVNTSGTGNCSVVANVLDTPPADGHPDAFPTLIPGTPVCWDVHPVASNTFQQPFAEPKIFKARLTVSGDGSPLDSRDVFFVLPPDNTLNIN